VADAGARRHGIEIVERLGAPLQEVVTLHVAVIFDLDVLFERLGRAEFVHHHRVVDDEVDGNQRVDLAGVAAQLGDGVAHRGKVDHAGHAGEVLKQHARGAILDLVAVAGFFCQSATA
jgi:predicted ABC-class ATPase